MTGASSSVAGRIRSVAMAYARAVVDLLEQDHVGVMVPIPAIVPLPGKAMAPMPADGVTVMAVDRGDFSLLGGRKPPNPLNPTPDSSQAVVNWDTVAGANGILGDGDDVTPSTRSSWYDLTTV